MAEIGAKNIVAIVKTIKYIKRRTIILIELLFPNTKLPNPKIKESTNSATKAIIAKKDIIRLVLNFIFN